MKALDTLVSDMAGFSGLHEAHAIADAGFVVGWGKVASGDLHGYIAVPTAPTGSATSSLLADMSESTSANFVSLASRDALVDDATIVSVAAPLPTTATGSRSSTQIEPVTASVDDTDAVDEAFSDFDIGPLDDALLEDLAVAQL
jgi:hypothetical protein